MPNLELSNQKQVTPNSLPAVSVVTSRSTGDPIRSTRLSRFNRRTKAGKLALLAYHEASHAVVFMAFTWEVLQVSLRRQGESLGRITDGAYQGDVEYFDAAMRLEPSERMHHIYHMQRWIMAVIAGLVGEAICRGEVYNQRRFDAYTNWSDGKPIPKEMLPSGYLEHTDRDKIHLVAERILVLQPGRSAGVAEHLRKAWFSTEEMLRTPGIWAAVERVAEALLASPSFELEAEGISAAAGDDESPYLFELAKPWSDVEQEAACRTDWLSAGPARVG